MRNTKREEVIVVVIVVAYLAFTVAFVHLINSGPSELAERITQGIKCLKHEEDCQGANRP